MKKSLILFATVLATGCSQEPAAVVRETPVPEEPEYSASALADEREAKEQMGLIIVEEAIQGFKLLNDERRYPHDLNELISEGMMSSLPELPPGSIFTYDASSGTVGVATAGEEEEVSAEVAVESSEAGTEGEPAPIGE